jgi:integrase
MARKPQVRYFPSRGGYYCQHEGRQHKLAVGPDDGPTGPTYLEALKRFREVLEAADVATTKDHNPVRVVLDAFLTHVARVRRKSTLAVHLRLLKAFCAFNDYGDMACYLLAPFHAYRFFDHMQQAPRRTLHRTPGREPYYVTRKAWSAGTVRMAAVSLKAGFNWGIKAGLVTRNPLQGITTPSRRSRGREVLLGRNAEEIASNHARILAAASKSFRPFLTVLKATGARPSEIAQATAAHFDAELGALVYHADHVLRAGETGHKTGSKGKTRTIILTGEALEIVRDLVQKHPTGPLFRARKQGGDAAKWLTSDLISRRFEWLRKKLGMSHLTAYSYRHTFATEWLKAAKSVDVLASLLGNSPDVIRLHYAHLLNDPGGLRRQLEDFQASATGTPGRAAGPAGAAASA